MGGGRQLLAPTGQRYTSPLAALQGASSSCLTAPFNKALPSPRSDMGSSLRESELGGADGGGGAGRCRGQGQAERTTTHATYPGLFLQ